MRSLQMLNYLGKITSVFFCNLCFKLCKSCGLNVSLSSVNQYCYVVRYVNTAAVYCPCMLRVTRSNSGYISFFFLHAAIMLFYFIQRIATKVLYFQKLYNHTHMVWHYCMSITPHKFVRPPCWYYREVEKYGF
jgi:hypothetical protein